ncbi:MAG: Re/Si-specific NAD(P)(+) transhydrogenase subunit alpha [Deltaproteobacteria bacterium]|nr:Re/Si-specific NAD(P)(+) transhydrogenase subunit alpha [Deltaproteobacteria bacterium]MDQ3295359.1 Re/Si-specific NAD(P)(+) transhydrogenase subunit alpha [Myxococcota bacterium]
MKLGIVKETWPGERRVAASPAVVAKWVKAGWIVQVERGAGVLASYPDSHYETAGATIVEPRAAWADSDIVVKLRAPILNPDGSCEADQMRDGATLVSYIQPAQSAELLAKLAAKKLTVLAMDQVPRISRAQKMDALSSMANISGYRAVIEAANRFGSFFTGQFTAAGKVPPAKVLIIGAGVAGLAALGAAKGLGAIVRAFDVRPAVEEQVKSLGGEFLTVSIKESGEGQGGYAKEMSKEFLDAEYALFRAQAREVDIVITTALIPGRPAPKLWFADMVELMKPGSVIVDMAAEQGGNCELTKPGEVIEHKGVTIVGYTDLASRMAHVASDLYGTNLLHFLDEMGGAAGHKVDHANDAVRPALVLEQGETRWPPPPAPAKPEAAKPAAPPPPAAVVSKPPEHRPAVKSSHGPAPRPPSRAVGIVMSLIGLVAAIGFLYVRFGRAEASAGVETAQLLQHLTVFVMAVFVGFQVVWNVAPALHTPLMSVTNAISGIIVVGGLLGALTPGGLPNGVLVAVIATFFATINIAGGFLVTRRMLAMFRK